MIPKLCHKSLGVYSIQVDGEIQYIDVRVVVPGPAFLLVHCLGIFNVSSIVFGKICVRRCWVFSFCLRKSKLKCFCLRFLQSIRQKVVGNREGVTNQRWIDGYNVFFLPCEEWILFHIVWGSVWVLILAMNPRQEAVLLLFT